MKKTFHRFFAAAKTYAAAHKIVSTIVAIALLYGGYKTYAAFTGTAQETRYVTTAAAKGTIVVSITGSGQVSASNQIDLKPKVSGTVTAVAATDGQALKEGDVIVRLDAQEAQKAVRDAQASLRSAEISFQKTVQPADALSLIQAENSLAQAKQSKQDAESNLAKAYEDGFNAVANAFLDLPGVVSGLDNVLHGHAVSQTQGNADAYYDLVKGTKPLAGEFRDTAYASYDAARAAYEKNFNDYKGTSRNAPRDAVEALIAETYDTSKVISEALKDGKNFLDLVDDALTGSAQGQKPAALAGQLTTLQSYTGTVNGHVSTLLNIANTIRSSKDTITSALRTIAEKTEALANLKEGADPLDIESQQLSVTKARNALIDAQENLADYTIRAPFDGVVAKVSVKKGDQGSSGAAVATFITNQRLAEISLNEVDAAKVKAGQKVTLTFDAVPDLTISGQVASVDSIGAVTQGVVTYAVQITFDTQDERVKPGMSVSSAIVTDVKADVLVVPSSAVKTQGDASYVEVFDVVPDGAGAQGFPSAVAPRAVTVEVGITNDTETEIISGLDEGVHVVVRTIAASAQTTATAPSLFGGGGTRTGTGAAGGAVRISR